MKNKGFGLFELIICMSFIFIILVQFMELSLSLYENNANLMVDNKLNNNIYNLYREIGYDFLTYNIKSITKTNNTYTFEYYKTSETNITTKTLSFDDGELIYNDNIYPYSLQSTNNMDIQDVTLSYDKFVKLSIKINDNTYDFICSNKIGDVSIL